MKADERQLHGKKNRGKNRNNTPRLSLEHWNIQIWNSKLTQGWTVSSAFIPLYSTPPGQRQFWKDGRKRVSYESISNKTILLLLRILLQPFQMSAFCTDTLQCDLLHCKLNVGKCNIQLFTVTVVIHIIKSRVEFTCTMCKTSTLLMISECCANLPQNQQKSMFCPKLFSLLAFMWRVRWHMHDLKDTYITDT